MNRNHHVISDGVTVTLGHGITEEILAQNDLWEDMAPHDFFGNKELILEQFRILLIKIKIELKSLMHLRY